MLAKDLALKLSEHAEDIAMNLFPNGKRVGSEWCVGSVHGEAGQSLKIHLFGNKAGIWSDFAIGASGDLLDLWALKGNVSISKAMSEVANYFNISGIKANYGNSKKTFVKPPRIAYAETKSKSATYTYLNVKRCLDEAVIAKYEVPHDDSEIVFNYIRENELIFLKKMKVERKNGIKQMYVSANCEPCLFGWNVIPKTARKVVICEGEIDAMSFCQYGIPALSVPFGGGSGDKQKWIEYEFDRLNRFDEIYVCMENDDAGMAGAKEIIDRLGAHRCRLVELPMKDANECLVNGISADDMQYYLDNAKTLDPEELRRPIEFTQSSYEIIHPVPGKFLGYVIGWDKFKENILFRPSGLSVWTGYNGHGKTLFLSHVMLNMIAQGARVCIASMELFPEELMARMYLQATAQEKPTRDFIDKIDEWMDGKLFLFNLVGTGKIERLLEVFLYARRRYGVDVFLIDSLTTLNIAEDDYNGQKELTEKLRDFKLEHNCHIHLVAHPRKPRNESEIPCKYDIRGGGAISDLADNCFSVWRNKQKEELQRRRLRGDYLDHEELEQLEKPDVFLNCDKNRHGRGSNKEGFYSFWFHEPSFQYLEREGEKPKPFIGYSWIEN